MSRLRELQARLGPGSRLAEPLARYTSIRAGGQADLFLQARTSEQLVDAVEEAEALGVPWRIIGGASNLLIADAGVEGLVIKAATGGVEIDRDGDPPRVHAAAGCILAAVAKQTALAGFAGLEWAVNVPGTVGASVVNNSGAFGSSTAEHLEHADVYAPGGEVVRMTGEELELAYRTSRLKRGELRAAVLSATYRLAPGDPAALRNRVAEIQRTRRSTQPSGYSVGSVFANPPGDAAGRLVDAAGLKGCRIGDAEISTLHGNFILNRDKASASDVLALINHVQRSIWDLTGVWLTPEVQLLGRWEVQALAELRAPAGTAAEMQS